MSVTAETTQLAMAPYFAMAVVGLALYSWAAVLRSAVLVKTGGGGDGDGDGGGGGGDGGGGDCGGGGLGSGGDGGGDGQLPEPQLEP